MAIARIYPDSNFGFGAGWVGIVATSYQQVNDPYGSWDDGTYLGWDMGSGGPSVGLFNMTAMPDAISIQSVTVNARLSKDSPPGGKGRAIVRISGTDYGPSRVGLTGTIKTYSHAMLVNPNTTLAWTVADVTALIAGCEVEDTSPSAGFGIFLFNTWCDIAFVGAPAQIEATRDVGARRLRSLSVPVPTLTMVPQLALGADVDINSQVLVQHFGGPHATAEGWLQRPWEMRLLSVESISEDPNPGSMVITLALRDRRPQLCLLQDYLWTAKGSAPSLADGVPRLSKGVSRTFTRASNAWVDDPASRYLVQVSSDQERLNYGGTLLEAARTNLIQYSGFQIGNITGWTKAGTGSNGSAIANDTADTYWLWDQDSTSVLQSAMLTSGSPIHVADLQLSSTATTSILANTKVRVSVSRRDDSGAALSVFIQRAVDSKYWRDSDSTWQAAKTWNTLSITSATAVERWVSKEIDVGGSNTTLTVAVGVPTATGTAGQINHVYSVQAEAGGFATSRILSTNASQVRAVEKLLISNNTGKRSWNNAQGAFTITALPGWNTSDIGNVNKTLAYLSYDANNYAWVYYDGTNDRWVFELCVATTVSRATLSATLVQDTAYLVVARWTGSNAELDLAAYTASIFVDGVKGTDVVTAAPPTESGTCDIEIGSKAGAENWDGLVRKLHTFVQVPTDEECARLA